MNRMRKGLSLMLAAVMAAGTLSCSNELNRDSSPVVLIVSTTSQPIQRYDLAGGTGCAAGNPIVLLNLESRVKSTTADLRFLDVRIRRYTVTYQRTDGGRQVPAPYDRALDLLLVAGASTSDFVFHITDFGQIFNQAPFVSLLPQNGGRDPETGRDVVKMNITLTVFGETLSGENVSGSTTFPLDVCYNCGGCQP